MKYKISAPLEIENLLPYDLKYKLFDKQAHFDFVGVITKGHKCPFYTVDMNDLLGLLVSIEGMNLKSLTPVIINNTENTEFEDTEIHLKDKYGQPLVLEIEYE